MSSPLQGDIAEQIAEGVSDIFYDVTLTRESDDYDPSTMSSSNSEQNFTGKGMIDEYSKRLVEDGVVQRNDRKVLLAQQRFTDSNGDIVKPIPGDTISARGETYEVIDVSQDPAQALWEVQCRA